MRSEISLWENRCSPKEPKNNIKPEWEIKLDEQVKNLQQQTKVLRKEKHKEICWDEKTKTVMIPTYMVMGYCSSIYTDSTWHSVR